MMDIVRQAPGTLAMYAPQLTLPEFDDGLEMLSLGFECAFLCAGQRCIHGRSFGGPFAFSELFLPTIGDRSSRAQSRRGIR